MPIAEVNGQQLYYEVHGHGEPPLLCVVGLGDDLSGWARQLPAFARRHRTVVFDNRDSGRSSYAEAAYEVADMAADTIGLADAIGLDRFHLIGMSLGGAIGQEVALSVPDRVLTLTLCVSHGGAGRHGIARAHTELLVAASLTDEELLDRMLVLTMSEAAFADEHKMELLRREILAHPNPQRRDGFERQALASARHEARDRLNTLPMPVHVIAAGRDLLVPVWKSRELASLIPNARLSVIDEAGHAVNVEHGDELAALVLDFIRASAP
jgi:pimeloyl-ACP methyl ester carboxylesterase